MPLDLTKPTKEGPADVWWKYRDKLDGLWYRDGHDTLDPNLKILCGEKTFHVHKEVVCSWSKSFANAVKPGHGFKVAQWDVIDLSDEKLRVVYSLLTYIYLGGYDVDADEDEQPREQLGFHIEMRAAADKYAIDEMKEHTESKIRRLVRTDWHAIKDGFMDAVHAAYDKLPRSTNSLHEFLVGVVVEHFDDFYEAESFAVATRQLAGFDNSVRKQLNGLVETQKAALRAVKVFLCPICEADISMVEPLGEWINCYECGTLRHRDEWNDLIMTDYLQKVMARGFERPPASSG